MEILINNTLLHDVESININDCEISLTFEENHGYVSIEAIEECLNEAGLSIGNYHFNHKDCYGNDSDYGTDLICVYHGSINIERL